MKKLLIPIIVVIIIISGGGAAYKYFTGPKIIEISKAGYFSAKLSVPEGLEDGPYGVTIYNAGNHIIEAFVKFEVKK